MEPISEFVAVEVKEEPLDNNVSSTTQQPSLGDSLGDHSEDPLSQCDEIGIKKEEDVCIKDEPVEELDPLGTSTTFVPTLKARPRSTRVKDGDREFRKKIRTTGGGPPPSPPKATEEFTIAASMMDVDLAMGSNVYDTFGQAPVNDRNGADVIVLQQEGSEYLPGSSDEEESCDSDGSDDEYDVSDDDIGQEIEEEGWRFISDPFSDARPDPLPLFTATIEGGSFSPDVTQFSSPGEAFYHFMDDDVIDKLCQWMNERAAQYFTQTGKRKVNGLLWRPVARDEMYVFMSLLMMMGVTKQPRTYMYWSKYPMYGGPQIFCKEVMARARFVCLLKFMRFAPHNEVDKKRPRTRVEPFFELLRHRSQSLLIPGKDVAIDEALILWKGRLGFRQFIKTKRSRFGIKVFVLCPSDPKWSGYSWNFEVYYGKDSVFTAPDPAAASLSMSEVVVVYLMKDLLDTGRHIVTDDWYTSLRLSTYLLTRDTLLTGVVRAGRGPPKRLITEKLTRHQATFARNGNNLVVKYMDKKEVNVITSQYTAGMVEKTKTFFGDKTVFFNKPLHIEKYNSMMGSVDKADQLLEPYAYHKKSLAWFKKLGIHFIFRMLLNSFIAYKNQTSYKKDFMTYIIQVSEELATQHSDGARAILSEAKKQKVQRPPKKIAKAELVHAYVRFNPKKQKKCRICTKDGKRKDTVYYCTGCPGEPGLCSMEHFLAWHSGNPAGGQRKVRGQDPPSTAGPSGAQQ